MTSSFRQSTSSYGPPSASGASGGAGGTNGMGSMQQLMRTQAVTMSTEEAATVLQCAYRKTVAERRVLEKLLDRLGSDGQGGESSAVVRFEKAEIKNQPNEMNERAKYNESSLGQCLVVFKPTLSLTL